MPKKTLFTTLGVLLAMVVASVALVFTVGPRVSADEITISSRDMFEFEDEFFNLDRNGSVLIALAETYVNSFPEEDFMPVFNVVIPGGVTSIRGSAGQSIMAVHRYIIGSMYGTIVEPYRDYSSALRSIVLPDNLISVGAYAFANCVNLTSIDLPENLTKIDNFAFKNSGLNTVIIPASVAEMGKQVFTNCENLTTIYCECSEDFARDNWDSSWLSGCDAEVIWDYVAPQNTNNENNQNENQESETPSMINEENKAGVVAAVAGTTGGAAGLGTIGTIIGVVISKKRKNQ